LNGSDSKAKQYALRLLSYRGRSEKEMAERLRKRGVSDAAASSTVNSLKRAGLIDDLSLAESLKREALVNKVLSRSGARHFMLGRGIPKGIIDKILRDDENTDYDNARRFVDKRLRMLGRYPEITAKRRLYNQLLRRGYSAETIIKVLREKNMKEEDQ